jgi:hypothetical protein
MIRVDTVSMNHPACVSKTVQPHSNREIYCSSGICDQVCSPAGGQIAERIRMPILAETSRR